MTIRTIPNARVAVIGAGPAGLAAARWLIAQGLEPVIFEASARLGGQWNPDAATSGTWRGMRTNTSRVMTAFSDLDHAEDVATYPRQDQMLAYLDRYAARFDLARRVRTSTRVERLDEASGGWRIRSVQASRATEEVFAQVIVATGRQAAPLVPDIAGIESFSGALGVAHSQQYAGAERYRGASVVVLGCSISALEIAADLASAGARVTSAYRRQRYVLPKLIRGLPTDHALFTRAAALLGERLPPEALAEGLKAKMLDAGGNPAAFGARAPHDNIFAAGITQSQGFLPAVAEGRIAVVDTIERIEGRRVRFADGNETEADAILLGTGYRLSLPWLAPEIAAALDIDGSAIDLHAHTFHPDLPGLAFLGLYDLVGPYLPVLELQARWIAYAFGGTLTMPSRAEMAEGVGRARAGRRGPQSVPLHAMAILFARAAGVEPDLHRWPALERALLFGPLSPASFRLQGPDALTNAPARVQHAAASFGGIADRTFTAEEAGLRDLVLGGPSMAA